MSFWFGTNTSDLLTVGTYRLTWKQISGVMDDIVDIPLPFEVDIMGKKIIVNKETKNTDAKTVQIEIQILENPIPALVIAVGVVALLGVTLGYLSLEKIEKLITSPVVEIGVAIAAIVIIFVIVKYFRSS